MQQFSNVAEDGEEDVCGTGRRKTQRQIQREQKILASILAVLIVLILAVGLSFVSAELHVARTVMLILEECCSRNENKTDPIQ